MADAYYFYDASQEYSGPAANRRFYAQIESYLDAYSRNDWLLAAVEKRLREELAALQVEINEEKSRIVDLGRGESCGLLRFDFRCIRSQRGVWRANITLKLKKRTALLRKLKVVFRRYRSQPVDRVIDLINPVLRGWVNYFAIGHASECFTFIQNWVEKKVRRHMLRARKRKGFGWTRWSRQWLYETLKLFNSYRVRRPQPNVAPAGCDGLAHCAALIPASATTFAHFWAFGVNKHPKASALAGADWAAHQA